MVLMLTRIQFDFRFHVGSSSHNEVNPNTKSFIHLVITCHDGDWMVMVDMVACYRRISQFEQRLAMGKKRCRDSRNLEPSSDILDLVSDPMGNVDVLTC
jgi:hypothetical protein